MDLEIKGKKEIMQEIILENLVKWFSNLNFSLNKQDNKLSLTCKELNIKIENLPREEFITEVTEQGINGVEKLFNLKVLGIDLRELFGIKPKTNSKQETKQEIKKPKQPETSAKTEKSIEDWIKEEIEKASKNGEFNKPTNFKNLIEFYKNQKYNFPDYRQNFIDFPQSPIWDQIICFGL